MAQGRARADRGLRLRLRRRALGPRRRRHGRAAVGARLRPPRPSFLRSPTQQSSVKKYRTLFKYLHEFCVPNIQASVENKTYFSSQDNKVHVHQ